MREADGLTEVVVIEEVFDGNTLVELVIIEEFARRGERPPRAKVYAVRIDKHVFHVHKADPTGEELLHLAGKNSANTKLYQIFKGKQPEPVLPTQHVDLHAPGVERFTTVPKDPREGASGAVALRRDFILPEPDAQYLDSLATSWSTVREPNGQLLLVIEDWRLPAGYNCESATLALVIPPGYPDTQVDMAYFKPSLSRKDGKPVNNLTIVSWTCGVFQQWSRHRTPQQPWRPGIDDLSCHLSLVDDYLRREFLIR